jgi:hypothetical protein
MTDLTSELWVWPLQYGDTLSNHDWIELHIHRLLGSRLVAHAVKDGRREDIATAILLWCESVKQDPAGTLPDDDVELASLARFGVDLDAWRAARRWALYGWRPVHIHDADMVGKAGEARLGHPFLEQVVARMHKRASSRKQGRDAANMSTNRSRVKAKLIKLHQKRLAEQPALVARVAEWLATANLFISDDNVIAALEQVGVPRVVGMSRNPET